MKFDPVTVVASRTPGFRTGFVLVLFGITQFIAVVAADPQSNPVVSGVVLWICLVPGWLMMSRARSQALQVWRRGDAGRDSPVV